MSDDIASFGFEVDSAPIVSGSNALKSFSDSANQASQSSDKYSKATKTASDEAQRAANENARLQTIIGSLSAETSKLTSAVNDNVAAVNKQAQASKAANDNTKAAAASNTSFGQSTKESTVHVIKAAEEVLKIAGFLKLASAVLYNASPLYKGFSDILSSKTAPALNAVGKGITAIIPGAKGAADTLKPLMKIADAVEIFQLANGSRLAAAGLLAVSSSARGVAAHEILGGIKAVPEAIGKIAPIATSVGGVLLRTLAPTLAFVGTMAAPVLAVAAAYEVAKISVELAAERIKKALEILDKSSKTGLGVDLVQRIELTAKKIQVPVDSIIETMKKFKEASTTGFDFQTGKDVDSGFDKKLNELVKLGNFANNEFVKAYQSAQTTEEKYAAATQLLSKAVDQGQRLAAIDLAATFLSPEMMDKFKAQGDFLERSLQAANKVSETKLISPEQIATAKQFKDRLEEAERILGERWVPFEETLVALGFKLKGYWITILETAAFFLQTLNQIPGALKAIKDSIPSMPFVPGLPSFGSLGNIANAGKKPEAPVQNSLVPFTQEQYSKAKSDLTVLFLQQGAVTQSGIKLQNTLKDNSKMPPPPAPKNEAIKAWDRAVQSIEKHLAAVQADGLAVGKSEAEHASLRTEMQLLSAAQDAGIGVTKDQISAYIEARASGDSLQAMEKSGIKLGKERQEQFEQLAKSSAKYQDVLENLKINSEISRGRQTAFLSDGDVEIANKLKGMYGDKIPQALASSQAAALRVNQALKGINDAVGSAFASFSKDIASGIAPMEALVSAAKKLDETLIDVLAKKVASQALGSLFSSFTDTASQGAGATSAAGILVGGGEGAGAAMIAGATTAAGILSGAIPAAAATLPVAGAATGTEVAAGGGAAGTALAVGGNAAALAIYGPIALLVAAVAAMAALVGFSGNAAEKQRQNQAIQGYRIRALQAGQLNPDSLDSQLALFDARATQERAGLPNGGLTPKSLTNTLTFGLFGDKGGQKTPELIALEQAQAAEREKIIRDFATNVVEAEKKAEEDRLQVIEDFGRAMNEVQDKGFINDFNDLFKQITVYQKAGVTQNLIDQFTALSSQKIIDDAELTGDKFNDLVKMFPQLTGVVHESTKALEAQADEEKKNAQAIRDATNANAKTILDYVNGLLSGSNSPFSPQARLTNAQAAYNSQLSLAQSGNSEAQANITKYAEDLRTAAQDFYGSSIGYQQIFQQITSQLLALPDVQAADDPTVVALRDVLNAINAGNATQALDATLQNLIKTAIDAGNASAIAAILVPKFDQLNTTADQGLDFNEFLAGLVPLSRDSTTGQVRDATGRVYDAATLTVDKTGQVVDATGRVVDQTTYLAGLSAGYFPYLQGVYGATTLTVDKAGQIVDATGRVYDATTLSVDKTGQVVDKTGQVVDQTTYLAGLSTGYFPYLQGVYGTTNATQVAAAATQVSLGSNVRAVFDAIDSNGDGILSKAEITAVATTHTESNTGQTRDNVTEVFLLTQAVKDATTAVAAFGSANVLNLMQTANETSAAQLNILNSQLTSGAFSFNTTVGNGQVGGNTFSTTVNNNMLTAINKVVFNTKRTADATGYLANHLTAAQFSSLVGSPSDYSGTFATGGVIKPFGLGLVSEHSPGGGRFIRAGAEPITVSPYAPANDNAAVVFELRAMRSDLADAKREIAALRVEAQNTGEKITRRVGDVADTAANIHAVEEKGWRKVGSRAGRG